ncbi:MAG: MotA/TolQ/ExbB proton channel family protein [Pirellulales bacterium]
MREQVDPTFQSGAGVPPGCAKRRRSVAAAVLLAAMLLLGVTANQAFAQESDPPDQDAAQQEEDLAEQRAAEALAATEEAEEEAAEPAPVPVGDEPAVNLLELIVRGGWLMVPIGVISILVLALSIERWISLRRQRVIPGELVESLSTMSQSRGGFDPRRAYRICQQHPSTTSSIIRAMLLKVGRPHSEVERTVTDASEREATRLYSNVRTLNLAAAVCPLLGLLGTVWGMIQAFFATANLPVGANKAEALAEGIYVALVTTFAGLAVAIPAAVMAHYFEGRIQTLIREIDDMIFSLLPQLERFEGKLRVTRQELSGDGAPAPVEQDEAAHSTAPAPK